MSQHSLQTLHSSLEAIPVALIFSKQLLLTQKSTVDDKLGTQNAETESYTFRATRLTSILKGIPGYNHGGLNE
jgi:hypothetical protein